MAQLCAELTECGAAQTGGCWAPQGFGIVGFPCFPLQFPPFGSSLAICDFGDIRKEFVRCEER